MGETDGERKMRECRLSFEPVLEVYYFSLPAKGITTIVGGSKMISAISLGCILNGILLG